MGGEEGHRLVHDLDCTVRAFRELGEKLFAQSLQGMTSQLMLRKLSLKITFLQQAALTEVQAGIARSAF